ncbi:MAG: MFS transporter [Spirochaetes bacterium]|nr:MFS transporter [Spirochaetota bacterium]
MGDNRKGLGLKIKLGFGVCDLGGNLFFTMMGFYLLYFLTDTVGLSAGLAGTALMVGKVWDAVTDPAVGYLSDRTKSPMGRRRPYILFGSVFLFIFMIVMFTNPGIKEQIGLFIWAALVYCLLNTAYTLVNIPYGALTPELTADFNERTVLNGFRMSFAVVGTLIGAGIVIPLIGMFKNRSSGWTVVGGIMGAVMAVTALITFFAVKGRDAGKPVIHKNIIKSYTEVLKLKPFILALLPWTLHITGITIIQGALLYYFKYIYRAENFFQFALLSLLVSSLIFIPVWVAISKRIGKKLSYNIGMLIFTLSVILFFIFGQKFGVYFAIGLLFFGGIGFATQYVMPYAIIPDVVEYDAVKSGVRREGIFYGLWTFVSKFGQAFAIALNGWVLSIFGYIPNVDQSKLSILGIKLLCGPVPALFFISGVIILSFYPITKTYYDNMLSRESAA